MKRMNNRMVVPVGGALLCMLSAFGAQAGALQNQSTGGRAPLVQTDDNGGTADLEKRMDALEEKLDQLIRLQEAQQASDGEVEDSPSSTAGTIAGLVLEVYMVPLPDERQALRDVQDGPAGLVSGDAIVKPPTVFGLGAFMDVPDLNRFSKRVADKRVALNWKGMLDITTSGEIAFSLDLDIAEGNNTDVCIAVLRIDGKEVVRTISEAHLPGYKKSYFAVMAKRQARAATEIGSIDLSEGLHEFSLWQHCLGRDADWRMVSATLRAKAPEENSPEVIAPERFRVKS